VNMITDWKKILFAALLGFLLVASVSYGQYITVRVTAVRGENQLPAAQVKRIAQQAIAEINRDCWTGLKLKKFEIRPNHYSYLGYKLEDSEEVLYSWRNFYETRHAKADLRVAVVPPFKVNCGYWMLGRATGTCERYGTAFSTAEPKNQQGYSRVVHSAAAFKHELSHLLGARDRPGSGLMDTGMLSQITSGVPAMDSRSQWEIVNCEGRWER
jgi:hypothetical protein